MKDIVIIGSGGFGREVAWLIERINQKEKTWNLLGWIDDNSEIQGTLINGYNVLGDTNYLNSLDNSIFCVCAVGSTRIREKIINKLENRKFANLIDPSVIISDKVKFNEGVIICAGSIITTNIELGSHVIINLDCTIGHDAVLRDFVTLYPSVNVSGETFLNKGSEIGTGTQIIQGKKIGKGTIVGAGSVVVKDLPDNVVAVGSPAKTIRKIEN